MLPVAPVVVMQPAHGASGGPFCASASSLIVARRVSPTTCSRLSASPTCHRIGTLSPALIAAQTLLAPAAGLTFFRSPASPSPGGDGDIAI